MAIPQHTIDQILDRTDIVDVIGQRVKLKKTGRTYSGCCPFHQEKSPSFHVYRDKGYFHCFGCQANGNAIRFLMDIDHRNFIDVMKDLAQHSGIELPKNDAQQKRATYQKQVKPAQQSTPQKATTAQKSSPDSKITAPIQKDDPAHDLNSPPAFLDQPEYSELSFHASEYDHFESRHFSDDPLHDSSLVYDFHDQHLSTNVDESVQAPQQEASLYDLLESVASYYQKQLEQAAHAQNYFQNRALNEQVIQDWRLGYAPADWQHLEKEFPEDIQGLKLVGLIRENDHGKSFNLLRDRVIFPIRDSKGRVVGFGGRALNDEIKPKYINSPDSEVFHKNQLLYGLYEGRKSRAQDWLMVEGYMDVIALHQAGITGAVATLGTASNSEHLNILFKQSSRLTLAFDGDQAGQKAARRTLDIALPLLEDGRELRFFILPEQHDPDSLIRQTGLEAFQQMLIKAPLLSDYLFAQLTQQFDIQTPEGKGRVMAELRQISQQLPNGSYKYLLSQLFRERLGFGRKKIEHSASQDNHLSFKSNSRSDVVVALLLHYPVLFPHFETLRAFAPHDSTCKQILEVLNLIYDQLPKEVESSRFYILGACHHIQSQVQRILNTFNVEDFLQIESPEDVDRHAQGLFKQLEDYYLKLKKPATVQEAQNLKKLRYEVQIALRNTEIKNVF